MAIRPCTDHLNNMFPSISELCRCYNISRKKFYRRLREGRTLEGALTGKKIYHDTQEDTIHFEPVAKPKPVRDHNEVLFSSVGSMCKFYGISTQAFYRRQKRGESLESVLTRKGPSLKLKPVQDFIGQNFPSVKAMCDHYKISTTLYYSRIKSGFSLEKALTYESPTKRGKNLCAYDYRGNKFSSIKKMCEHYNISTTEYYRYINKGESIDSIFEKKIASAAKPKYVMDFEGNTYPSIRAMCEHWNISIAAFNARRKYGWDLEKALTKPVNAKLSKKKYTMNKTGANELIDNESSDPCVDHENNRFPSVSAMCRYWGINYKTYEGRRLAGESKESALTRKIKPRRGTQIPIEDHEGNRFSDMHSMARHWGVKYNTLRSRLKRHNDIEYALTGKLKNNTDSKDESIKQKRAKSTVYNQDCYLKNITVINEIEFPYYIATLDDNSDIIITISDIAKIFNDMTREELNPNSFRLYQQLDLLEKSPSISDWLMLEDRLKAYN